MLSKAFGSVTIGTEAVKVEIEIDISPGLPGFYIGGLAESSVKESRERVKAAIKNSGYNFPTQKITANLAPADIKKEGTGLDLPIALAVLCASNVIQQDSLSKYIVCGELSLDGSIRSTRGVLPIALLTKKERLKGIICPKDNAKEAAVVRGIDVIYASHLTEIVGFFQGINKIIPLSLDVEELFKSSNREKLNFADVIGQESAKRALEVAAAGGHNVLMIGPPGSGKTMLAQRLPTILPPLSFEEALETSAIYSVAGLLPSKMPLITQRPFCAPHHTISDAGMIGGGTFPRPGQVSLAHNGVLFLDELPEFKKNVLESLRQPLEDGFVTICRASTTLKFPSRFTLIAAQNPCPCGFFGEEGKSCSCTPSQIHRYRTKVSGPLLDRIDIQIEVPAIAYKELSGNRVGESSEEIKKRVIKARNIQYKRFQNLKIFSNAQMSVKEINRFCKLNKQAQNILEKTCTHLKLSARAYHRILKIARTIADLEDSSQIDQVHILEAVQYRGLDRRASI